LCYINKNNGLGKGKLEMKNLRLLIIFFLLALTQKLSSQTKLAEFTGTDLNGYKVDFPKDILGKKSLVGFAFSRKSQEDLESWAQPVYDEFIDKESLASLVYDANVYLIIVFNAANASFKGKLEKELKENILVEFFGNIILCEDDSKYIRTLMKIDNEDIPILYALNEKGEITHHTVGHYSDRKMEVLSSFLEME
jgi:hypothetical protein